MGTISTFGFPSSYFWSNAGASYGSMWNPGHTGLSMMGSTLMGPSAWTGVSSYGGFGMGMGYGAGSFAGGGGWGQHLSNLMSFAMFPFGRPMGMPMRSMQNPGYFGRGPSRSASQSRPAAPAQRAAPQPDKKPKPDEDKVDKEKDKETKPDKTGQPTGGSSRRGRPSVAGALRSAARRELPRALRGVVAAAAKADDGKYVLQIHPRKWAKLDANKQQLVKDKLSAYVTAEDKVKGVAYPSKNGKPGETDKAGEGKKNSGSGGAVEDKDLKATVEGRFAKNKGNSGAWAKLAKYTKNVSASGDTVTVRFTPKAGAEKLSPGDKTRVTAALKAGNKNVIVNIGDPETKEAKPATPE